MTWHQGPPPKDGAVRWGWLGTHSSECYWDGEDWAWRRSGTDWRYHKVDPVGWAVIVDGEAAPKWVKPVAWIDLGATNVVAGWVLNVYVHIEPMYDSGYAVEFSVDGETVYRRVDVPKGKREPAVLTPPARYYRVIRGDQ